MLLQVAVTVPPRATGVGLPLMLVADPLPETVKALLVPRRLVALLLA